MGLCELCGKRESIVKISVEGSQLDVCNDCSRFGKIVARPLKAPQLDQRRIAHPKKEDTEDIVPGFGPIIKSARERLGLKQAELAKRISEKESLLHSIESQHFKPPMELAKKLEKALQIKLISKVEDKEEEESKKKEAGAVTIGDLIRIKMKK